MDVLTSTMRDYTIVGTIGTTSSGAVDHLQDIGKVCEWTVLSPVVSDRPRLMGKNRAVKKHPTVFFYIDAAVSHCILQPGCEQRSTD